MRLPEKIRSLSQISHHLFMNLRLPFGQVTLAAALLCLVGGAGACRKTGQTVAKPIVEPPQVTTQTLDSNGLGALPGALYQAQADSPIHWQPWTPETMARAKAMNRLVFAVVVMPQFPGWQAVTKAMEQNAALVSTINSRYMPVLVDGDASREVGLLALDLCAEIKCPLNMPLFIWMTAAGNPVAWIPVKTAPMENVVGLFTQSDSMIAETWQEDLRNHKTYVLDNSASDNANRRARIGQRKNTQPTSKEPATEAIRSLRQLVSFYDAETHSMDETGGLFPSGTLSLLATAAIQPGVPPEVRTRCLEVTRALTLDLVESAMFDPLDGGLFASRQGSSWCLPSFSRDCVSQGRALIALTDSYRATGEVHTLEKARGVIASVEKNFSTQEGLFAVGVAPEIHAANWLWSIEEIEKELPPEDAKWWIQATKMKGMGNLPTEVDLEREHFRSNSISLDKSATQLATELGQPVQTFLPRFEAVRLKLLAARDKRLGAVTRDECSHAGASFRMVSAYAAMFGITGEVEFRDKAVALLGKSQQAFSDGPNLRTFSKDAPKSVGAGRAFIYGLAMQAALDVSAISSEGKFLTWTEDLATTAAELFTSSEFLKECPDDAKIIDLPVTDLTMLFDDSTSGLISFAECRLADRGRPLVASFSALATPLPASVADHPTLHTDILQATLAREFKVSIVTGEELAPELRLAAERLPPRMFQRRAAKPGDAVPAGSIMIRLGNGESHLVSTVQALQQAVLPSPVKS
jgi:uncharacterized protein YyaL (SSP411 family)